MNPQQPDLSAPDVLRDADDRPPTYYDGRPSQWHYTFYIQSLHVLCLCATVCFLFLALIIVRFIRWPVVKKPLCILSWPPRTKPIRLSWPYLVTVVTGRQTDSETKGTVRLTLHDDLLTSGDYVITGGPSVASNPSWLIFDKAAQDNFLVVTDDSLGDITRIDVQLSAKDQDVEKWLLAYIVVHDLKRDTRCHLSCNDWIIATKIEPAVKILTTASPKTNKDFQDSFLRGLEQLHVWIAPWLLYPVSTGFDIVNAFSLFFISVVGVMFANCLFYFTPLSSSLAAHVGYLLFTTTTLVAIVAINQLVIRMVRTGHGTILDNFAPTSCLLVDQPPLSPYEQPLVDPVKINIEELVDGQTVATVVVETDAQGGNVTVAVSPGIAEATQPAGVETTDEQLAADEPASAAADTTKQSRVSFADNDTSKDENNNNNNRSDNNNQADEDGDDGQEEFIRSALNGDERHSGTTQSDASSRRPPLIELCDSRNFVPLLSGLSLCNSCSSPRAHCRCADPTHPCADDDDVRDQPQRRRSSSLLVDDPVLSSPPVRCCETYVKSVFGDGMGAVYRCASNTCVASDRQSSSHASSLHPFHVAVNRSEPSRPYVPKHPSRRNLIVPCDGGCSGRQLNVSRSNNVDQRMDSLNASNNCGSSMSSAELRKVAGKLVDSIIAKIECQLSPSDGTVDPAYNVCIGDFLSDVMSRLAPAGSPASKAGSAESAVRDQVLRASLLLLNEKKDRIIKQVQEVCNNATERIISEVTKAAPVGSETYRRAGNGSEARRNVTTQRSEEEMHKTVRRVNHQRDVGTANQHGIQAAAAVSTVGQQSFSHNASRINPSALSRPAATDGINFVEERHWAGVTHGTNYDDRHHRDFRDRQTSVPPDCFRHHCQRDRPHCISAAPRRHSNYAEYVGGDYGRPTNSGTTRDYPHNGQSMNHDGWSAAPMENSINSSCCSDDDAEEEEHRSNRNRNASPPSSDDSEPQHKHRQPQQQHRDRDRGRVDRNSHGDADLDLPDAEDRGGRSQEGDPPVDDCCPAPDVSDYNLRLFARDAVDSLYAMMRCKLGKLIEEEQAAAVDDGNRNDLMTKDELLQKADQEFHCQVVPEVVEHIACLLKEGVQSGGDQFVDSIFTNAVVKTQVDVSRRRPPANTRFICVTSNDSCTPAGHNANCSHNNSNDKNNNNNSGGGGGGKIGKTLNHPGLDLDELTARLRSEADSRRRQKSESKSRRVSDRCKEQSYNRRRTTIARENTRDESNSRKEKMKRTVGSCVCCCEDAVNHNNNNNNNATDDDDDDGNSSNDAERSSNHEEKVAAGDQWYDAELRQYAEVLVDSDLTRVHSSVIGCVMDRAALQLHRWRADVDASHESTVQEFIVVSGLPAVDTGRALLDGHDAVPDALCSALRWVSAQLVSRAVRLAVQSVDGCSHVADNSGTTGGVERDVDREELISTVEDWMEFSVGTTELLLMKMAMRDNFDQTLQGYAGTESECEIRDRMNSNCNANDSETSDDDGSSDAQNRNKKTDVIGDKHDDDKTKKGSKQKTRHEHLDECIPLANDKSTQSFMSNVVHLHESMTRVIDEDYCLAAQCDAPQSCGMCGAVHTGPPLPPDDGFRVSMITDIEGDSLARLWDEHCTIGQSRRASEIAFKLANSAVCLIFSIGLLVACLVLGLEFEGPIADGWIVTTFLALCLQAALVEPLKVLVLVYYWFTHNQLVD